MRRVTPFRYEFAVHAPARRGRAGLVLSLLLHAGILALLLIPLRADFARVLDPGRREGRRAGGGGGGGGSREAYISLPAPAATPRVAVAETPPPERTPPPVAVQPTPTPPPEIPPPPPVTDPPAAAPAPAEAAAPSQAAGPGTGPGAGGGAGGGVGGGIGPGVGPGSGPGVGDSGSAGQGRGPRLKHQVFPAYDNVPKAYRGRPIRAVLAIDASGRVRRVTFDPPLTDGKFADQLEETMLAYRFYPALGPDGAPIPSTSVQTITAY